MRKTRLIGIVVMLLIQTSIITGVSTENKYQEFHTDMYTINASILTVDDEGDGDFLTVQEAIDTAISGDIIRVYSGTYNETVSINVEHIIVEGINYELGSGNDNDFPIVNGDSSGDVVKILSDNVTLMGFIIQNSGADFFDAGIRVYSNNTLISSNGIIGNFYGIVLNNCSKTEVVQNYITYNVMDGMYLVYTYDNTISNNVITDNGQQGIYLLDTYENDISHNTISLNGWDGIHFKMLCTRNTVSDNTIHSNNIDGIKLKESEITHNLFTGNHIYSNRFNGIHIMSSNNNTFLDNEITLNLLNGIHLGDADNNVISRNTIRDNFLEGIVLLFNGCQDNLIYHNNIVNNNAFDNGNNNWDHGYPSGGNYWSYYPGTDEDGDGIGETPYVIPGADNQDRYPFVEPLLPPDKPSKPMGTDYGRVGSQYSYSTATNDPNHDSVQFGWDWDGDKNVDLWTDFYESGETCTISHSWDLEGTYQIYVRAMDEYGLQSEWSDPLVVSMPKTKAINLLHLYFLERLIDYFPLLASLLTL